jgi:PAS domain S-box-containing protein
MMDTNSVKNFVDKKGDSLLNQLGANIIDLLPVGVYTCNTEGYITSYNKAAAKFWGRSPELGEERWFGSTKIYNINGTLLSPENCQLAKVLKQGAAAEEEQIVILQDDGTRVVLQSNTTPTFDADGTLTGAVTTMMDVTGFVQDEEKQAILAAIIDTSEDTIISKTLGGIITSWNAAAEKLFGYTEAEVLGKHISILIPKSRLNEEDIIIGNIARGIKINHFETVRVAKDGTEIPISLSVSPVTDSKGRIIGASKIARDLSENKRSEEKQAMLAAIVNSSDDAIVSKTLKGMITSWNKGAEAIFGYTEAEVLGKHISILIPRPRLSEEEYIIGQVAQGNKVDHFETIRLTKNGTEIPVSLSVSPIKNSRGKIIGASKIAQKQSQERLKRYADNLEMINSVNETITEDLDLNKILQKVTDATTALTGARFGAFFYNFVNPNGDALMLYTTSGVPKDAFENFSMPHQSAVFKPNFRGEGVIRIDDIAQDSNYQQNLPESIMPNSLSVVSYLAVPVISRSGSVIGGLLFGHPEAGKFTKDHEDIVISIAAQAAIGLENAKLYEQVKALNEKKDEFIGMASHELKTPLTSITGYLQILQRLKGDESSKSFIAKTAQQVKKLSALVSDLLDVSKVEAGKLQLSKENFDICHVIDEAIELIQHSNTTHQIFLEKNVDCLTIFGDPQRVEQVIINLLTNAIKYSPSANRVEVSLNRTDNEVIVGVKDAGFGIPADKLINIFSRFYRVDGISPAISGLGIGLYISHDIIERHNGKLWAESELGKGSTFWFTLPISS